MNFSKTPFKQTIEFLIKMIFKFIDKLLKDEESLSINEAVMALILLEKNMENF
jgi:hypothetical protein